MVSKVNLEEKVGAAYLHFDCFTHPLGKANVNHLWQANVLIIRGVQQTTHRK